MAWMPPVGLVSSSAESTSSARALPAPVSRPAPNSAAIVLTIGFMSPLPFQYLYSWRSYLTMRQRSLYRQHDRKINYTHEIALFARDKVYGTTFYLLYSFERGQISS